MAGFFDLWVFLSVTCATVCAGFVLGAMLPADPLVPEGHDPSGDADPGAGPGATGAQWLDLAPELGRALRRAAPTAGRLRVVLASAVQSGLALPTDRRALRAALDGVLEQAMDAAPGGKVLLTARREGWVIEVAVLDDGAGVDPEARRGALRPAESALALQGGSLEIAAVAGEGTTVRLRLPAPGAGRPQAAAPGPATPAATSPAPASAAGVRVSFAAG